MGTRAKAVLGHLRENSRKTLAAIAREEGVAISTIFDHVNKLEKKYIEKHTALLNYPSLGYPFRTFFYCDAHDQEALINHLKHQRSTNSIHQLSSGIISVDMIFKSLQEEEHVKEHLEEHCVSIKQHRILEPVLLEGWTTRKRIASEDMTSLSGDER